MGFWEIMSTYGLIISIIMMVISLIISANCKHAFNKYSKVMASNGMTGAEAAQLAQGFAVISRSKSRTDQGLGKDSSSMR